MSWRAGSLHYIVFSQPRGGVPDALQPWTRLFGGPPQAYQQLPGSVPSSQASGPVGEYQFGISAQPGRLELVLLPPEQDQPSLGFIRDHNAALGALRGYAHVLENASTALRVAVIVNAFKPMASALAATEDFRRNTQLAQVPDTATDLLLTLNIRKTIPALNISINRLCKWGTAEQHLVQMQATSGLSPSVSVEKFYVSTLQLDLNTVPEQMLQPSVQLDSLVSELVEELGRLLSSGYDYLVT